MFVYVLEQQDSCWSCYAMSVGTALLLLGVVCCVCVCEQPVLVLVSVLCVWEQNSSGCFAGWTLARGVFSLTTTCDIAYKRHKVVSCLHFRRFSSTFQTVRSLLAVSLQHHLVHCTTNTHHIAPSPEACIACASDTQSHYQGLCGCLADAPGSLLSSDCPETHLQQCMPRHTFMWMQTSCTAETSTQDDT